MIGYSKYRTLSSIVVVIFSLLLSSCSKNVINVGYSFGDLGDINNKLMKIKINQSNELDVLELLGSPSTFSNYGSDKFFYISSKISSQAFFKPSLEEQKILEISFNKQHVVTDVKHYGLSDACIVKYDTHDIYIKANKLKIFEQLTKNIGRFNSTKNR